MRQFNVGAYLQEAAEHKRSGLRKLLGKIQINGLEVDDWLRIYAVRPVRYFFQRIARGGWDDSATWSLDDHLAKLILPRLKRFKELNVHGWPGEGPDGTGPKTHQDWHAIVDQMIFAFEWHADDERKYGHFDEAEYAKVEEGMFLFAKYYGALWD